MRYEIYRISCSFGHITKNQMTTATITHVLHDVETNEKQERRVRTQFFPPGSVFYTCERDPPADTAAAAAVFMQSAFRSFVSINISRVLL